MVKCLESVCLHTGERRQLASFIVLGSSLTVQSGKRDRRDTVKKTTMEPKNEAVISGYRKEDVHGKKNITPIKFFEYQV